jgi:hypothetical protein
VELHVRLEIVRSFAVKIIDQCSTPESPFAAVPILPVNTPLVVSGFSDAIESEDNIAKLPFSNEELVFSELEIDLSNFPTSTLEYLLIPI